MPNTNIVVETKKEKTLSIVWTVLITIAGSIFISIGTVLFLNPAGLYSGGVTGLAQIILHILGTTIKGDFNAYIEYLGILNFIFLLPFNILAWFKLSKKYAIYTFISSVAQTIALIFARQLNDMKVFYVDGHYDMIACTMLAAITMGLANGMLMRRGATSGGFITLCQYLNIKKGKSVGFLTFITSSVIMVFGAATTWLGDPAVKAQGFGAALSIALYTLVFFILSSIVLDFIHTSYNRVKLEIVTEKGNEVVEELLKRMPHGITELKGVGSYTKREKDVLNVIVQSYEASYYINNVIMKVDPNAFISIIPCQKIIGKFNNIVVDK